MTLSTELIEALSMEVMCIVMQEIVDNVWQDLSDAVVDDMMAFFGIFVFLRRLSIGRRNRLVFLAIFLGNLVFQVCFSCCTSFSSSVCNGSMLTKTMLSSSCQCHFSGMLHFS